MGRLVLRLPEGLMQSVKDAAEEDDKLPTEWVRDLIRRAFEGDNESEDGDTEDERDG